MLRGVYPERGRRAQHNSNELIVDCDTVFWRERMKVRVVHPDFAFTLARKPERANPMRVFVNDA
jgi:hypothetical protein